MFPSLLESLRSRQTYQKFPFNINYTNYVIFKNSKSQHNIKHLLDLLGLLSPGGSSRRKQCLAESTVLGEFTDMDFEELCPEATAAPESTMRPRKNA